MSVQPPAWSMGIFEEKYRPQFALNNVVSSYDHKKYTVSPNDDLLSIVRKTSDSIDQATQSLQALYLMEENDLPDLALQAGQELKIPSYYPSTWEITHSPKVKEFRLKMLDPWYE